MSGLAARTPTVAATPVRGSRSTVSLLRVDAALRDAVPADDRPLAERFLVVAQHALESGQWWPEVLVGEDASPFAALLLRGVVTHDVILAGRCSATLLGPGDVFRPWRSADTSLPCEARWAATGDAAIAMLDERFLAAARRWPGLSAVVYDRLAAQLENGRVHTAIAALPRVEERVLALFWQLADRWGTVRPDGVVVELALTHALIGHLVGAQRPTVSLALHTLAEHGLLNRQPTGAWLLRHDSCATLAPDHRHHAGAKAAPCARPLVPTSRVVPAPHHDDDPGASVPIARTTVGH